jgi:hypothetical protein
MIDAPLIPVAWGEIFDKLAILTIKSERLTSPEARINAMKERAPLENAARTAMRPVAAQYAALLAVNTRLWGIEDRIRLCEAAQDFGPVFVALARAVYRENDERSRIKRAINLLLGSPLVEEKQYPTYR